MSHSVVKSKAEGDKNSPTILSSQFEKFAELSEAKQALMYEVEAYQDSGAEVHKVDETCFVVVDESDRAKWVIEIV